MPEPLRYETLIAELRKVFPQPVSDPMHDAYFVYSILQALDRVDNLKSQVPLLGRPIESLAEELQAAVGKRVPEQPTPQKQVIEKLTSYLEGMVIYGHPRSQVNVISVSSIASIVGALLPTIYNPNLV